MKRTLAAVFVLTLVFAFSFSPQAVSQGTEVDFWHSMTGARLDVLEELVEGFNEQAEYGTINPTMIGTYAEGLARFLEAHHVGEEPGIVQIYEVGTQIMHDSGMIIPAYEIPEKLEADFDFGQYNIPIVEYYSREGNLWSWPFASSTAMMYYNADHFEEAGLDPNSPPKTWDEVHEYGEAIIEAGVLDSGIIAFGWPSWQFEQQHALHNQPFANEGSGREGHATEVSWPSEFSNELLAKWGAMAEDDVWFYAGPEYEVNAAFTGGQVSMILQSTSSLDGILRTVGDDFQVRTTFLPRLEGYPAGNSVIGGNSLYVSNQVSEEELEVIFEFYKYLAEPENDKFWHQNTGYFPATNRALRELMDEGWFQESPNHLTAFLQILHGRRDTPHAIGTRLGPFVQSREYIREGLERIDAGHDPETVMGETAEMVNSLLRDYLEDIEYILEMELPGE